MTHGRHREQRATPPLGLVRHLLPGIGVLPRDPARDSASGLVGSVIGFASGVAEHGVPIELWGLSNAEPGASRYRLSGADVVGVQPYRRGRLPGVDARYLAPLALHVARRPAAVIHHVHALPTLLALPRASWRVLHLHMALGQPTRLEHVLLRRANAVVCASSYLAQEFQRKHGWYGGTVRVIRNGADPARYVDTTARLRLRQALRLGVDDVVVLFAGQVAPEKGIDHLVAALELLPAERRPRLVIAGSSGLWRSVDTLRQHSPSVFENDLHQRASALNAAWLGKLAIDAMPAALLAADVVACPSVVPEGLGTINLEAAAAGRPVVASRVGGIPEIVHDGETGLLVPPADPAALAAALALLANNATLRGHLGATARTRVHTWQQASDELLSLYRALVAHRT